MNTLNPALKQWLEQSCSLPTDNLKAMAGDASFRRYFRLEQGLQSYVVMDASLQMDCFEPFVAIAKALQALGVAVPEVLAEDAAQGFMLIADFGDTLYLNALQLENADALYQTALDALVVVQSCREVPNWPLPHFDQTFMQRELAEFKTWFLERYLKLSFSVEHEKLLQTTFSQLTEAANQQAQVFIHRDYHSANLMVLPQGQVGILDFQDACIGPITYDLVSLVRDCYIDWPAEKVQAWVLYYYERLRERGLLQTVSFQQFSRCFDWMGIQRHMKALFIFARKYLRDGTTRYLKYLPRTLGYVLKVSAEYPELANFNRYAREFIEPAFDRVSVAALSQTG